MPPNRLAHSNQAAQQNNARAPGRNVALFLAFAYGASVSSPWTGTNPKQIAMHEQYMPMPTIDEIRASIRRYGKVGNTVWWSGDVGHMDDITMAKRLDPPGTTLRTCLAPEDREKWAYWQQSPWKCAYWKRIAAALAMEASGDVYLLVVTHKITMNSMFKSFLDSESPDLFWHVAFPRLMRNEKVEKMMSGELEFPVPRGEGPTSKKTRETWGPIFFSKGDEAWVPIWKDEELHSPLITC